MSVTEAILRLKAGDTVAIPTETVYGLAADIKQISALKKIFSTKERPFFDPLIVHVDSIEKAKKLVTHWSHVHEALAQKCWPGPLTLIAPKADVIDPIITSGLTDVALRCPNHPLSLNILKQFEGLAAPSANKFGKTSPTRAEHVRSEFSDEVYVVDGGECEVGIESTVVAVTELENRVALKIYRPGFYSAADLEKILSNAGIEAQVSYAESPVAPGHLKHHYMPRIPVVVGHKISMAEILKISEGELTQVFTRPIELSLGSDPQMAAREFYQKLRLLSHEHDVIVVLTQDHHHAEEWLGIMNRLTKAASVKR